MSRAPRSADSKGLAVALVCVVGLGMAIVVERASEERANRLQRGGNAADAARLYGDRLARQRARTDTVAAGLVYNFGTALLDLGSPVAGAQLTQATSTAEPTLRVRAIYNLGRWHLLRARDSRSPDSVRVHAGLSVSANKDALRLEPGQEDARWNLALAQRMLDSVNAQGGPAGSESTDGATDADERITSDDLREFEDGAEVTDAPREGSDEALAQGDEVAAMSALEAERILITETDRSVIVRKLLTFQGRSQPRPTRGRPSPRW